MNKLEPKKPLARYVLQRRIPRAGAWADLASDIEYAAVERILSRLVEGEGPGQGLRIVRRETTVIREAKPLP